MGTPPACGPLPGMPRTATSDDATGETAVSVVVRVRPPLAHEAPYGHCARAEGRRVFLNMSGEPSVVPGEAERSKVVECDYDSVLDMRTTQEDVWQNVRPTVDKMFEGYNATFFTYGMTGSGKTFTMLGPKLMSAAFEGERVPSPQELRECKLRGVVPRVIEHIFDRLPQNGANSAHVSLSYLQIYRERCYDLLRPAAAAGPLKIREEGGTSGRQPQAYVEGLTEVPVQTVEACFQKLVYGFANIAFRATNYNEQSSRSHSVFTITIQQQGAVPGIVRQSKIRLVDLAGNERWETFGPRMSQVHTKELTSINQSLSTLGTCIQALSAPAQVSKKDGRRIEQHVPYRNSALTMLLRDSLSGNSYTKMLCTVCSCALYQVQTLCTLRFADRAKRVKMKARVTDVIDPKTLLKQTQAEVEYLRSLVAGGGMTAEVRQQLEDLERRREELEGENRSLKEQMAELAAQISLSQTGNLTAHMDRLAATARGGLRLSLGASSGNLGDLGAVQWLAHQGGLEASMAAAAQPWLTRPATAVAAQLKRSLSEPSLPTPAPWFSAPEALVASPRSSAVPMGSGDEGCGGSRRSLVTDATGRERHRGQSVDSAGSRPWFQVQAPAETATSLSVAAVPSSPATLAGGASSGVNTATGPRAVVVVPGPGAPSVDAPAPAKAATAAAAVAAETSAAVAGSAPLEIGAAAPAAAPAARLGSSGIGAAVPAAVCAPPAVPSLGVPSLGGGCKPRLSALEASRPETPSSLPSSLPPYPSAAAAPLPVHARAPSADRPRASLQREWMQTSQPLPQLQQPQQQQLQQQPRPQPQPLLQPAAAAAAPAQKRQASPPVAYRVATAAQPTAPAQKQPALPMPGLMPAPAGAEPTMTTMLSPRRRPLSPCRCPDGHPLANLGSTLLPRGRAAYDEWHCDGSNCYNGSVHTPSVGRFHCARCQHDVCSVCAGPALEEAPERAAAKPAAVPLAPSPLSSPRDAGGLSRISSVASVASRYARPHTHRAAPPQSAASKFVDSAYSRPSRPGQQARSLSARARGPSRPTASAAHAGTEGARELVTTASRISGTGFLLLYEVSRVFRDAGKQCLGVSLWAPRTGLYATPRARQVPSQAPVAQAQVQVLRVDHAQTPESLYSGGFQEYQQETTSSVWSAVSMQHMGSKESTAPPTPDAARAAGPKAPAAGAAAVATADSEVAEIAGPMVMTPRRRNAAERLTPLTPGRQEGATPPLAASSPGTRPPVASGGPAPRSAVGAPLSPLGTAQRPASQSAATKRLNAVHLGLELDSLLPAKGAGTLPPAKQRDNAPLAEQPRIFAADAAAGGSRAATRTPTKVPLTPPLPLPYPQLSISSPIPLNRVREGCLVFQ